MIVPSRASKVKKNVQITFYETNITLIAEANSSRKEKKRKFTCEHGWKYP